MSNNQFVFRGRIESVSALQSGTSQNGDWKRIHFVMREVDTQYPQSLLCKAKGELAQAIADTVTAGDGSLWDASIAFSTHSFQKENGEVTTICDIKCWSLKKAEDKG